MKAARLHRKNDVQSLSYEESPQPEAGEDELLVRVHAAGVTPAEVRWTPWESSDGRPRESPILCHEFSGVVARAGSKAAPRFPEGTEIFAFTDFARDGGLAEYAIALPSEVAAKPKKIGHPEAAAIPMSALTAWQGLFEVGKVAAGKKVLIHGAAGGVGSFAVQLARWAGAWVAGTASSENVSFLRKLGVDRPIDYLTTPFEKAVDEVDVVFDGVGRQTVDRSWGVLKSGGIMVSIASSKLAPPREDVTGFSFIVRPDGGQLAKIADLVDAGNLTPYLSATYPLNQAREAYARGLSGHNRGKAVIIIKDEG